MDDSKRSKIPSEMGLLSTEISRQAIGRVLFWISILVISGLAIIIPLYFIRGLTVEAVIMSVTIFPLLLVIHFTRMGRTQLAAGLIAVVLTIMITILATIGQGIHDIAIIAYPSILIIASLILKRRAVFQLTAITILCLGWLVFGEILGLFTPDYSHHGSIADDFIATACILLVTAGAVHILSNTVNESLRASQKELSERVKTENALRETEQLYRTLVEQTPVVTYRDIPDGNASALYISPQIEDLTGYTPQEWLSSSDFWKSVVHPDDLPGVLAGSQQRINAAGKSLWEYRMQHKQGGWVWVRDESVVVKDEQGKALYIHGTCIDITERKEAEMALKHYAREIQKHVDRLSMLNNIGKAVSSLQDLDSVLEVILEQVQRNIPLDVFYICLYDESTEQVSFPLYYENGQRWQEPTTKLTAYNRIAKTLREGELIQVFRTAAEVEQARQAEYHLGDKTKIAASALFVPMLIGKRIIGAISVQSYDIRAFSEEHLSLLMGVAPQAAIAIENSRLYMAVVTDMTSIKKIELEREALIRELESKNAELEQFTYTVSHDLKSPLITIRGYLPYLEKDAKSGNQERLQQDLQRIEDATQKMHMLLTDLLELSRIGRLINPPEIIPFEEIVREALSLVEGKLSASPARVQIGSGLPDVYGDRARLVEVMQNLLDNAASYMGSQPEPVIEVGVDEVNGECVFYVKDNGIGIDPRYHERIFGLFNKLNPDSEGTGVGLSLVKRIVEVHGGKIWVESELDKGAKFCFTLGKPNERSA